MKEQLAKSEVSKALLLCWLAGLKASNPLPSKTSRIPVSSKQTQLLIFQIQRGTGTCISVTVARENNSEKYCSRTFYSNTAQPPGRVCNRINRSLSEEGDLKCFFRKSLPCGLHKWQRLSQVKKSTVNYNNLLIKLNLSYMFRLTYQYLKSIKSGFLDKRCSHYGHTVRSIQSSTDTTERTLRYAVSRKR